MRRVAINIHEIEMQISIFLNLDNLTTSPPRKNLHHSLTRRSTRAGVTVNLHDVFVILQTKRITLYIRRCERYKDGLIRDCIIVNRRDAYRCCLAE